jgi:hypothetical protein
MPRARSAGLLVGVFITLALGACGGDAGGGSGDGRHAGGDAEPIVDAITGSFTSGDPEACTTFNTQRLLEQGSGLNGAAAIKACEESAGVGSADSVEVSGVSVHGDTASGEVAVTGSELDGQTLALNLVRKGGHWKVDQLADFVSFDREALNAGVAESFRQLGIPSELRICVISGFEGLSDDQVQHLYLSVDKQQLQQIILACGREARTRNLS